MRTIIAGGTGFLGRALARALAADGHDVVSLTRGAGRGPTLRAAARCRGRRTDTPARGPAKSTAPTPSSTWPASRSPRAAGPPRRSTASSTAACSPRAASSARSRRRRQPPQVFISGSAVGYYGPLGDEVVDRRPARRAPTSSRRVCVDWEAEALRAAERRRASSASAPGSCSTRDGGALPQMLPPFWFGAGGPVGSGRQYWPWIHLQDWVDLVRFAIQTPAAAGPLNATAPTPVTNAEFARAAGPRASRRPAFMPAPGFALKLLLGEMAEAAAALRTARRPGKSRAARRPVHLQTARRGAAGTSSAGDRVS